MKTSKLWDGLAKDKFARIDESFLSNFRAPGNANSRLAAWDPFDTSMRYFKFLVAHQIQTKDALFFSNYARIGETALGNPVMLEGPSGEAINLDHLLSVEEYTFLRKNLSLEKIGHVVEVGAGFGRTAQALVKLTETIKKYTIIDIPEVLSLSSKYLEKVLNNEEYAKFDFVNAQALTDGRRDFYPIDLVINIDSFQEMPRQTVEYYFDKVVNGSRFFYSKNAVGKYRPESIGLYDVDDKQLFDVLTLGLSTDIVDIFSERELSTARRKHVEQYRPKGFTVIAQEPLGIFPYYHNVLYGRGSD
jgi:putative sugar O-methyltransferase